MFIVLEGADGTGKSTQAKILANTLRGEGREVVTTFEPGGTDTGETLRKLVLESGVSPIAETLLMAADRAVHVAEVIRPALDAGRDVVCDRFTPSTLAYQGVGRDLGVEGVERLSAWAADGLEPDLVIVFDAPLDVASARRGREGDRLERDELQRRVRQAYLDLAPDRGWLVLDATRAVAEVAAEVWAAVSEQVR